MSDFKKITGRKYTTRDEPRLTVYTSGYGRINKCATEQYLTAAGAVEWYLNDEDRALGIKARTEGDDTTYSLSRVGGGAVVTMRAILKETDLNIDKLDESVSLPLEYNGKKDLIVADLKPLYAALERAEFERSDVDYDEIVAELEEGVDDETFSMIPDGWDYGDIAALCRQYDDVYSVADELGLSRAKGAFLLRTLGLIDHMERPQEGDVR